MILTSVADLIRQNASDWEVLNKPHVKPAGDSLHDFCVHLTALTWITFTTGAALMELWEAKNRSSEPK